MTKTLLALSLLLAGCLFKGPHVPSDLAGDIPLRVANHKQDPICTVVVQPFSEHVLRNDNWLGTSLRQQKIAPGAEHEFRIKAGVYSVGVVACNQQWGAGTQGHKLAIDGPTYVEVGTQTPAPADFKLAMLPIFIPSQNTSSGGGEEQAGGEEAAPESSDSSESSSSSESSTTPAEPEHKDCLPPGTATDNYHKCCSEAAHTQVEPDERIFHCA